KEFFQQQEGTTKISVTKQPNRQPQLSPLSCNSNDNSLNESLQDERYIRRDLNRSSGSNQINNHGDEYIINNTHIFDKELKQENNLLVLNAKYGDKLILKDSDENKINYHQQESSIRSFQSATHTRDIPIEFIDDRHTKLSSTVANLDTYLKNRSPIQNKPVDSSFTLIPVNVASPTPLPLSDTVKTSIDADVEYAIIARKQKMNSNNNSNSLLFELNHYDFPKSDTSLKRISGSDFPASFPADAIEMKHQREMEKQEGLTATADDRHDSTVHDSEEPPKLLPSDKIISSLLPSNVFKRMDHLNTIFIRPTTINKDFYSNNRNDSPITYGDKEIQKTEPVKIEQNNIREDNEDMRLNIYNKAISESEEDDGDNNRWINNPMLNDVHFQHDESSLSPVYYEISGLSEIPDDEHLYPTIFPKKAKRVKFSVAPIRVYPTYSANEYDRRNNEIDPFSASAEYELEKRIEKMNVFSVDIEKGPDGLGISVLGMGVGADSGLEKLGIFVKSLNPNGVIALDGRIKVGDQIIEVDNHSLVGVTHTFATGILKATAGTVRFLIGREKDPENSEVLRLIHQSLQMDHERNELQRVLHQHEHYNHSPLDYGVDDFPNTELNDDIVQDEDLPHDVVPPPPPPQQQQQKEFRKQSEMTDNQSDMEAIRNKNKNYEPIWDIPNNKQNASSDHQSPYLLTIIEELEKLMLSSASTNMNGFSSMKEIRQDSLTKKLSYIADEKPEVPERIPLFGRSRTSSDQIPERPPSRTTASPVENKSVRSNPSPVTLSSLDKNSLKNDDNQWTMRSNSYNKQNSKALTNLDFEVGRSPLLNNSIQMTKSQIAKNRPKNPPSKRLSNQMNIENIHANDEYEQEIQNGLTQNNSNLKFNVLSALVAEPPSTISNALKQHSTELTTSLTSGKNNDNNSNYTHVAIDKQSLNFDQPVKDWTSDQCIQWLSSVDMNTFIPLFLNRNIDGEKLLTLDSTKLKAIGIKSSKERDLLKQKLKELKYNDIFKQPSVAYPVSHHYNQNRMRSSSLTKLKERRLFGASGGK
ncbi:unnamed protein product, partial [Didymodactylos carnosus]